MSKGTGWKRSVGWWVGVGLVVAALVAVTVIASSARRTVPNMPAFRGPTTGTVVNARFGYAVRVPGGWKVSTVGLDGLAADQSSNVFLSPPMTDISQDGPFITISVCRATLCGPGPHSGFKIISTTKEPATLSGVRGVFFHLKLETKSDTRTWTEDHLAVQRDGFTYDMILSLTSMGTNRLSGSVTQPKTAYELVQKSWTWKSPQDALSTSFHHVYVIATVTGMNVQSGVLKSMDVRVDQNVNTGADQNIPFKLGSSLTVAFDEVIHPDLKVRVGDRVQLPLVKDGSGWRSELKSYMMQNTWIHLQSPLPGQTVAPGQTIQFRGTVSEQDLWGKEIGVSVLAGFRKPSNAFYQAGIPIGKDGTVDSSITLPNKPFPPLNGNGITVLMQPSVRQGPVLQVIVLPTR